jgi:hypothetical protein
VSSGIDQFEIYQRNGSVDIFQETTPREFHVLSRRHDRRGELSISIQLRDISLYAAHCEVIRPNGRGVYANAQLMPEYQIPRLTTTAESVYIPISQSRGGGAPTQIDRQELPQKLVYRGGCIRSSLDCSPFTYDAWSWVEPDPAHRGKER